MAAPEVEDPLPGEVAPEQVAVEEVVEPVDLRALGIGVGDRVPCLEVARRAQSGR
jgi:hypothetical protein